MLISQSSRLGFRISKLDLFEAQVLFQFLIEGPLLAGYKLINNNNFKDRSFQQYLILDILTNPVGVTLTKKGKILGKNPLPVSLFTYYSLRINLPFS